MAKRHHNSKVLIPSISNQQRQLDVKITTKIIKKITKVPEPIRRLELTLEGGTRCTISENDREYHYNSERFEFLWNNLSEKDTVEVTHSGMKILSVYAQI